VLIGIVSFDGAACQEKNAQLMGTLSRACLYILLFGSIDCITLQDHAAIDGPPDDRRASIDLVQRAAPESRRC
jgi:hypothetical protein